MSDVRDSALRDLLDEHTMGVAPHPDALDRVHSAARRRHRRRRLTGGACALVATTVALSFAGGVLREPVTPRDGRAAASSSPAKVTQSVPQGALSLRNDIGITGQGKGEVRIAVAKSPAPGSGGSVLTAVQVETGLSQPIPGNATSVSFSPQDTTVALVTKDNRVVVESIGGSGRRVLGRQRPGAAISWDPGGTALFALVDGHWIRVPAPDASGTVFSKPRVRVLRVPRLPGGPSFLSVSPAKDLVVLFGVSPAKAPADSGDRTFPRTSVRPHLYLGRFQGLRVTSWRPVHVPATATQGPMGWLGDNAFVVGTGVGTAWIVRVKGSHLVVAPDLPIGCALAGAPAPCRDRGPRLLGTNAGGSLLFWRVRGVPAPAVSAAATAPQAGVIAYFSTWLDGSHAKQLTGPAGTYGPALAAR